MSSVGGQRGVLEAARALRAAGQGFALALVTDTEGSTYRKAGALALVASDGTRTGTISGGCLEPALVTLCQQVMAEGRAGMTVFDTRGDDDLLFGSGSGCRGRMRVLAWPLPGAGDGLLDALLSADAAGATLSLAVTTEGKAGDWRLADAARPGEALVRLAPVPRVLLLGAGPEAAPLVSLALTLGWRVQVADHRDGLLADARLPDDLPRLAQRPAAALAAPGRPVDAVLVMTHLASADLEALRTLAPLAVPRFRSGSRPSKKRGTTERIECASHRTTRPCKANRRISSSSSFW